MAVWAMILGSIGWVIFATFSADKMEKVQSKLAGGDPKKLMTIATAAIIGAFSAMSAQHITKIVSFTDGIKVAYHPNALACVLGAILMGILMTVSEKKNIKWLKEWNLTFAILGALLITVMI